MISSRLGLGFSSTSSNCLQFSTRNLFNSSTTHRAFHNSFNLTRNAKLTPKAIAISRSAPQQQSYSRLNNVLTGGLITTVGLGLFTWNSNTLHCEPALGATVPAGGRGYATGSSGPPLDPPQSTANIYQLSFGTVCGICAGVFIKKGAKFIAFILGGAFVFLQYFSSQRLVKVDWSAISKRYDSVVDSAAGPGGKVSGYNGSTAQRIWNRGTHFLMADFQPRATFMAGLLLGLRLG